ncbi:hypothetical protein ACFL3O_01830 [Candidatus Neomarinimicrobiota bacterium]
MGKHVTTSIVINSPCSIIWNFITNYENWKHWYAEGLKDITPGWQTGAVMSFESDLHPIIIKCIPEKFLAWDKVALIFNEIDTKTTKIIYDLEVSGSWIDNPYLLEEFQSGMIQDINLAFTKLKMCIEQEQCVSTEN